MIQGLALATGAGILGYGIYKIIENINKEVKVVNNTYNKMNNIYNQINNTYYSYNNQSQYITHNHIHIHNHYVNRRQVNYKNKIKNLHDMLFENWLKLKNGLNQIENKKRKIYKGLKRKNLSNKQKNIVAGILNELKNQSIEMRNMKQEAYKEWQNARRLLLA